MKLDWLVHQLSYRTGASHCMKYVLFSTFPNILGFLGMIFPHEMDIISRLMFPHKYISVGWHDQSEMVTEVVYLVVISPRSFYGARSKLLDIFLDTYLVGINIFNIFDGVKRSAVLGISCYISGWWFGTWILCFHILGFSWILIWLVVWNMNFMTFHSVGNVIIPTDFHSIIFQRGR